VAATGEGMKLSFVVSVQETGFDYIGKGNLSSKLNLVKSTGYNGVELSIRNPSKVRLEYLEKQLSKNSLELSAIGTGQMFVDDGLSLSSLDRQTRKKAVNRIKEHIDLAEKFESRVIIGLARGKKKRQDEAEDRYRKHLNNSIEDICEYAEKRTTELVCEPINRYETQFLNRVDETLGFIKSFKCSYLKIMLDTFHMNIEEKDIPGAIKMASGFIAHVHLADSNRLCPGDGHIDFKEVIDVLKETGYKNYLSAEVLPVPNFKVCAEKYIKTMRAHI